MFPLNENSYMHTCLHRYIYTYEHMYIYINVCVRKCICTYVYVYVYVNTVPFKLQVLRCAADGTHAEGPCLRHDSYSV